MTYLILIIGVAALLWLGARTFLQGKSHAQYDSPQHPPAGTRDEPSPAHHEAVRRLMEGAAALPSTTGRAARLKHFRALMDEMGASLDIESAVTATDAGGVPAEWVVAPGADADRRLLYLHGGAFTMGSAVSHRAITNEYSRRLGVAVLAIDYRLMPEHKRQDCISDCQAAYRWILDNGPAGPAPVDKLVVSGDSAGGNLTLMLIAWARDQGLRAADAAIALSPATDATLASPSLLANAATDVMLGPMFGRFARLPQPVILWLSLLGTRINPSNPLVSPLHGDLKNLPPLLVQASTAEMLLDDGVRYVNKANAQNSSATLATWPFMLHVWQIFVREMPEAQEAFDQIETFVKARLGTQAASA